MTPPLLDSQVNYAVNWNQLLQWMDNMMILETQAYIVGDLHVPAGVTDKWNRACAAASRDALLLLETS